MSTYANSLVLVSEVILSAYPLLIKLVDTSIIFQTGLRMFVFTICAVLGAIASNTPILYDELMSGETLASGILNLIHVLSSYYAFDKLPAGNAMAIFYTYPVFNIIGTSLLFGELFPYEKLHWILLALAGAVAVSQPTSTNWSLLGVVSALIAALTETCIYLWFKSQPQEQSQNGPWKRMIQLYGGSGILWLSVIALSLIFGLLKLSIFNVSSTGLAAVIAFNTFVGFLGYALRFYTITKVSTIVFSALSFFGVVAAYIFGFIGTSELPTIIQSLGALAIIVANGFLLTSENA